MIVGGGAAGLTAATYLARFRRRIVVVDAGCSRLQRIPTSHNYPGFTAGIHGEDVLARLREQALHYGVDIEADRVTCIEPTAAGTFVVRTARQHWPARTVVLATGVEDVAPPLADVDTALACGGLRYCPICDGFEAIGKRVAVLGHGNSSLQEAIFVRHYATEVHLCAIGAALQLQAAQRRLLDAADVQVLAQPVNAVALIGGDNTALQQEWHAPPRMRLKLADGSHADFDVIYSALGTLVNTGPAKELDPARAPDGTLQVDAHQQTTVDGLYAVGDVVAGLNQIVVAMGQAAVAATAIHNRLRLGKT